MRRSPVAVPCTPTGVRLEATDQQLRSFLMDDLGEPPRDVTSDPLFDDSVRGEATVVTRQGCTVAGVEEAARIFELLDVDTDLLVADGNDVSAGTALLRVDGPTVGILRTERTALNLLGRMCGIATMTRRIQRLVETANPQCQIAATRKTTPGFRMLEKRAVWLGGGDPHRYGLFDQVLIKDNHRAAGGDLPSLIETVRDASPKLAIEVEVETLADAITAARAGVEWILVDNQDPDTLGRIAAAIHQAAPETRIEASGGITAANVAQYAKHADRVSMGALTQSAPAIDVSLEWAGTD